MRKVALWIVILFLVAGCRSGGSGSPNSGTSFESSVGADELAEHEVVAEEGETVSVVVVPEPEFDVVLALYDPAGELLEQVDDEVNGQPETLEFTAEESGTYVVGVSGFTGGGSYTFQTGENAPVLIPTVEVVLEEEPAFALPPTYTPAPPGAGASEGAGGSEDAGAGTLIPGATDGRERYVVQPGDTLANIAAHFGVTLQSLVQANNIENIDLIEVGQVLIIPR